MIHDLQEVIDQLDKENGAYVNEYFKEAGNGLWFDIKVFLWLKKNEPEDLQKILKAFPLSEKILFDYEQRTK